jgi:hypothetical protein
LFLEGAGYLYTAIISIGSPSIGSKSCGSKGACERLGAPDTFSALEIRLWIDRKKLPVNKTKGAFGRAPAATVAAPIVAVLVEKIF